VEAVMRAAAIAMILAVLGSTGAAAPPSPAAADRARGRGPAAATDDDGRSTRAEREDDETDDVGAHARAADPGDEAGIAGSRIAAAAPPVHEVLAAAYASAGLDRHPGRGWIRRTRLAGLIPWVTVRAARDTSWQDAHSEVGHGEVIEVRATWRLDRLLFDGRELQVATIEAARRRERQRLATRVIHCYFAWRRAAASAAGGSGARGAARAAEAIAELDALTDGWFSDELARGRRAVP
jgi:hypothetical protein